MSSQFTKILKTKQHITSIVALLSDDYFSGGNKMYDVLFFYLMHTWNWHMICIHMWHLLISSSKINVQINNHCEADTITVNCPISFSLFIPRNANSMQISLKMVRLEGAAIPVNFDGKACEFQHSKIPPPKNNRARSHLYPLNDGRIGNIGNEITRNEHHYTLPLLPFFVPIWQ